MNSRKILLCDDDHNILEVLKLISEFAGAEVETESNSSHVYNRLITDKPDILIIDLWMPHVTGDKIIKMVKSNDELKDIYVLCISASADGRSVAESAGADKFIPKPFDMADILDVIEDPKVYNRAG